LLTNNPIILSTPQLPYFFESQLPAQKGPFTLSEATSKHCVQVLRMTEGALIQLTNGQGLLATAQLSMAHKKHSQVDITEFQQFASAKAQITIAIAPTKNMGRIEWLLEKLTEIGISRIILMHTERTERTVIKLDRLEQILIAAMLQSRQVYLPELSGLVKYGTVLAQSTGFTHKWIAHCLENSAKKSLSPVLTNQSHIILIGPEGDFSATEIDQALAPENQFEPVTLGQTRLRTETAGLVAGVLLKMGGTSVIN